MLTNHVHCSNRAFWLNFTRFPCGTASRWKAYKTGMPPGATQQLLLTHNAGFVKQEPIDIDEVEDEASTIEKAVKNLYECDESILKAKLAAKGIPLGDDCSRMDMIVRLAATA